MNKKRKDEDYEKINNAVDNDTNCWVINGNRICGAYTFEDDKTKIESEKSSEEQEQSEATESYTEVDESISEQDFIKNDSEKSLFIK